MGSCYNVVKKEDEIKPQFMENGRMLLEELISTCDGKCNPMRTFSTQELQDATNNYDYQRIIFEDYNYTLYQGFFEGRRISVKTYGKIPGRLNFIPGSPFTNIAIGSQMSVHKNVLKLIGCCLETEHPILVHEFAGDSCLYNYLSTFEMSPSKLPSWKFRVKIALDIANAIAYLHNGLPKPVVHREIHPSHILLDEAFTAKLVDFSLCEVIPLGESYVKHETLSGRKGTLAPEYYAHGYVTEKTDVYSFGVLLFEILTGRFRFFKHLHGECRTAWVNSDIDHVLGIVDPPLREESIEEGIFQDFAMLALKCINDEAENRPTMIAVAKEVMRIYYSAPRN
ncbi:hypothetical protein Tsubulata_044685 [Turnera subulata]|uniref:Protein kinase domain-containing protein n=1 Tax=Turnera subulata TaxID=218843 RepID=A0A9Q0G8U8_9ROSI|nr:hypothetical protein Tsubulata_044685 [Turnera subulata]